jgi:hypothetical protein
MRAASPVNPIVLHSVILIIFGVARMAGESNAYRDLVWERDHYKDLDVGGRIILILRDIGWYGMNWIHLAHYRDRWQALVYMLINLRGSKNVGENMEFEEDEL